MSLCSQYPRAHKSLLLHTALSVWLFTAASAYLCPLVRLGPIAGSMQNLASNSPCRPSQIPYCSKKAEIGKERLLHPDLSNFLAAVREQ